MRVNLPITDKETHVGQEQYLFSRTDLKGRITYCNPAFVEISGFSREELSGKAHNIVRHPDMPPQAYADMWKTIQSGKPWSAPVKNRRKDGGYYWVHANVMPIFNSGQIVGYASVRVALSETQKLAAQKIYDSFKNNAKPKYYFSRGRAIPVGVKGWFYRAAYRFRPGIRWAVWQFAAAAIAAPLAALWWSGKLTLEQPWVLAAGAAWTVASLTYGSIIHRKFMHSLECAQESARQIAAGNLSYQDATPAFGELRELSFYLDTLRKSLTGIAKGVSAGIERTSKAMNVLRDSSICLESRTHSQAAALQETAASLEELTVTVRQNADNAVHANELSRSSLVTAQEGREAVEKLVQTMKQIDESSRKIGDIVTLIDGIAFQTNILALNASVEAARAGTHGRGFAVVASEVRTLSQRSAQAAREIKALIEDSVRTTSLGAEQADAAGQSVARITTSVQEVADLIEEFSVSSGEQSLGLEQINEAVTSMDVTTTDNATMVHELTLIGKDLSEETYDLQEETRVLSIGDYA